MQWSLCFYRTKLLTLESKKTFVVSPKKIINLKITKSHCQSFLVTVYWGLNTHSGLMKKMCNYLHVQSLWFFAISKPGRHSQATPTFGVSRQIWAQPWSLFMQFMPSVKKQRNIKGENINQLLYFHLKRNLILKAVLKKADKGQRTIYQYCLWFPCSWSLFHYWLTLPCSELFFCVEAAIFAEAGFYFLMRATSKENSEQHGIDLIKSHSKSPDISSQRQKCLTWFLTVDI